jgi:hypothetical protein
VTAQVSTAAAVGEAAGNMAAEAASLAEVAEVAAAAGAAAGGGAVADGGGGGGGARQRIEQGESKANNTVWRKLCPLMCVVGWLAGGDTLLTELLSAVELLLLDLLEVYLFTLWDVNFTIINTKEIL